jgi:hypothetical protein
MSMSHLHITLEPKAKTITLSIREAGLSKRGSVTLNPWHAQQLVNDLQAYLAFMAAGAQPPAPQGDGSAA